MRVLYFCCSGMAYENPNEENKGHAFDDIVSQARQNSSAAASGANPRPQGVQDVKIILWGNGFQVQDDGPFRAIEDPANAEFLAQLKQGVVPNELRQQYPNGLEVALEDKRG